ncbi:ROK family transcriptional regulator [Pseudonocardia sp. HH130630-07]|uniref:ROK family transcriptional regulator n=1 Tax=Pseudonocardia sp. HH130630-07 TaxID=1690815 RepID=UPI00081534C0|nr:ROK family transcriptional regulator [Pseudonocardia sp. HH130630-07]ANY09298.1 transcriptional regulator [Pseudonocardia sp. HH130630-07]
MPDPSPADRPGSQAALRRANRDRVLAGLRTAGEAPTQADLVRRTGLAPATVSTIVRDLRRDGLVTVAEVGRRRRVRLRAGAAGVAVGVDYGHRHVTVATAGADGLITAERRAELAPGLPARDGLALAAGLLGEVLAELGAGIDDLAGIGMGLPAPIDTRTGGVGSLTILPTWVGLPAARLAAEAFGRPVVVDNDANLGALAEQRWGRGSGVDALVYLKLSEGVGAGLIMDGRLYRGPAGTAGEIGHTTVDEFGALCRCGNRGCLETLIAARHVADLLRPLLERDVAIGEVVARARAGERAFARVINDVGLRVGAAIADVCNMLNPQMIVVGGELAQADDLLLEPIRQVVSRRGIPSATDQARLTTAGLGARAHVLGAAAVALEGANHIPSSFAERTV